MANFEKHRYFPPNWEMEYSALWGRKKMDEMAANVISVLTNIPRKSYYDIERNVREEHRDFFIKISCLYINIYGGYSFNETFTIVKNIK